MRSRKELSEQKYKAGFYLQGVGEDRNEQQKMKIIRNNKEKKLQKGLLVGRQKQRAGGGCACGSFLRTL